MCVCPAEHPSDTLDAQLLSLFPHRLACNWPTPFSQVIYWTITITSTLPLVFGILDLFIGAKLAARLMRKNARMRRAEDQEMDAFVEDSNDEQNEGTAVSDFSVEGAEDERRQSVGALDAEYSRQLTVDAVDADYSRQLTVDVPDDVGSLFPADSPVHSNPGSPRKFDPSSPQRSPLSSPR